MGRGDKKTKKGKRFASSYGKVRVRKEKTKQNLAKPKAKKKAAPKKKSTSTKKKVTAKKKAAVKKKASTKKSTAKKN